MATDNRVARFARELWAEYRRPDPDAVYHWRFGLLVGVVVGLPLILGGVLGQQGAGSVAALAAWFMALAVPPRTVAERAILLGRRWVVLVIATAGGVATGHHWWLALIGVVLLALLVPIRAISVTALITFLMAVNPVAGVDAGTRIAVFAAGAGLAAVAMLLPVAASPAASPLHVAGLKSSWQTLRTHISERSPQVRYAVQTAVAVGTGFTLLSAVGWPHLGWVLVGVLTTLRPSWEATHTRVVKRSIGMVGGSLVAAAALAIAGLAGYPAAVVMVIVLGALARPLRQVNYGYWPVLGTPVLLLLASIGAPLTVIDSVWRLGNNLLGAAVTLVTVTLVWPHTSQRPPWRPAPEEGTTQDET